MIFFVGFCGDFSSKNVLQNLKSQRKIYLVLATNGCEVIDTGGSEIQPIFYPLCSVDKIYNFASIWTAVSLSEQMVRANTKTTVPFAPNAVQMKAKIYDYHVFFSSQRKAEHARSISQWRIEFRANSECDICCGN